METNRQPKDIAKAIYLLKSDHILDHPQTSWDYNKMKVSSTSVKRRA